MKRQHMLKSKKDFKNLLNRKKIINSSSYVIYFLPNNLNYPRFGISISKKKCKYSVDRNRTKRQIKSVLHDYVMKNKNKNIDILIVVKEVFFSNKFSVNKLELGLQLNKI